MSYVWRITYDRTKEICYSNRISDATTQIDCRELSGLALDALIGRGHSESLVEARIRNRELHELVIALVSAEPDKA